MVHNGPLGFPRSLVGSYKVALISHTECNSPDPTSMFDIDKQPSLSKPRDRHIKEDSENKAVFFLSQFKLSFLLAIGYTAKSHKQKPYKV